MSPKEPTDSLIPDEGGDNDWPLDTHYEHKLDQYERDLPKNPRRVHYDRVRFCEEHGFFDAQGLPPELESRVQRIREYEALPTSKRLKRPRGRPGVADEHVKRHTLVDAYIDEEARHGRPVSKEAAFEHVAKGPPTLTKDAVEKSYDLVENSLHDIFQHTYEPDFPLTQENDLPD
jgi:hypothetical protein